MGVVYLAFDPKIDRQVAIKTIQVEAMGHALDAASLRRRFILEARTAGRLSHANIATVYDVGEEGDTTFIAMEYVEGRTLESYLAENPVPRFEETLEILEQIAAGLDAAHAQGVVHRDVKPANILIRADGQVKITDFGIARFAATDLTQTGTALGTPSYMSPEQLAGEELDGRTDLYALGVIAFRMLTGEKPYQADEVATLIVKIMQGKPADPIHINPLLPQACRKVLTRAIHKEREKRYASGAELVAALRKVLLDPQELRRLMELTRRHRPPTWWQRWSPWIAGGLMAVAAVSLAYTFLLRPEGETVVVAPTSVDGRPLAPEDRKALALVARAESKVSEGRRLQALADFEAAWRLSPEVVRLRKAAYVQLLLSLAREAEARHPERAIERYARILELSPEYTEVYRRLGRLHGEVGDWEAARDDFLEYLSRRPDDLEARFAYAKGLYHLGRYQEALGELWAVIEKHPPFLAQVRLWRGLCWERLGERHKAAVNYRKALALDPGNRTARQRLRAVGG
ncbi:MAG: hypothetical protein D6739_11255 [Nitrospirae bacterium]|nr:MAG: hypothetical protein D6739_11255 [Nitrospirota bacterium]